MFITLGLAELVLQVNGALMEMAPSIGDNTAQYRQIPYTTESIVSECVSVAGSSRYEEDLQLFLLNMKYHLYPFCNGQIENMSACCLQLIYALKQKFKEFQWFDSDGSCPWRFVGFEGPFHIQLGKPDGNTNKNTGNDPQY
jgi:hypothetical protein